MRAGHAGEHDPNVPPHVAVRNGKPGSGPWLPLIVRQLGTEGGAGNVATDRGQRLG
jgi:hypothetical protein